MTSLLQRHRRPLLALLGAALAASVIAAPVAAGQSGIAGLRNATAPFHDIAAAKAAGYTAQVYDINNITCIADPNGTGTMGIHFLNPSLLGTVDPTKPPAGHLRPAQGR